MGAVSDNAENGSRAAGACGAHLQRVPVGMLSVRLEFHCFPRSVCVSIPSSCKLLEKIFFSYL